jgi:hypothetical protein
VAGSNDDSPSQEEIAALIEREHGEKLEACRSLIEAVMARIEPWQGRKQDTSNSADELISLEFGRSTKTMRAAVHLAANGFGEQAAMLNRSLFESMLVAHWVHANPELATEQFKLSQKFDRHLAAELIRTQGWEDGSTEEELSDATLEGRELQRMEKLFGPHGEKPWVGLSIYRLLEEVEDQWPDDDEGRAMLWQFWRVVHNDNNQLLHSSSAGMRRVLGGHDEYGGKLWVGPSTVHIDQALFGSFWIYAQIAGLMVERFELGDPESYYAAYQVSAIAFVGLTPEQVKDAGRNDPCPCGSGRKYKRCHGG